MSAPSIPPDRADSLPAGSHEPLALPTEAGCAFAPPPPWRGSLAFNRRLPPLLRAFGVDPVAARREAGLPVGAPVVMTGHQPRIPHPGIAAKLYAAEALAAASGGIHVHKITDTDDPPVEGWRVPAARPDGSPYALDFSGGGPDPPREEDLRAALESLAASPYPGCGAGAAAHGKELLQALGKRPGGIGFHRILLDRVLPGLSERTLVASALWETPSFAIFRDGWFERFEEAGEAFGTALAGARRILGTQDPLEPAPDLGEFEGGRQTPFWAVGKDGVRRTLLARREGSRVVLRPEGGGEEAHAGRLSSGAPFRVWPKALLQTLYCRAFLCDFFVHGSGGSRYEVANQILFQALGEREAPRYGAATATVFVDLEALERLRERLDEIRERARQIHLLARSPEDFWGTRGAVLQAAAAQTLREDPEARRAAWEAQDLRRALASPPSLEQRRRAAARLKEIRRGLLSRLEPALREGDRLAEEARRLAEAEAVLAYREYPFFCYDPAVLERIRKECRQAQGVES